MVELNFFFLSCRDAEKDLWHIFSSVRDNKLLFNDAVTII